MPVDSILILILVPFPPAPEMDDKKDEPIVAYVGDSVAMACKTKLPPNTWLWYRANGTEQVRRLPKCNQCVKGDAVNISY